MICVCIHWTCGDIEDSLYLGADTIEEIRVLAEAERVKRGLDEKINNMWSEVVS